MSRRRAAAWGRASARVLLALLLAVTALVFADVSAWAAASSYRWYTQSGYLVPTPGGASPCGGNASCGWLQSVDGSGNSTPTSGSDVWQSYCQNTSTGAWETDSAGSGGFGQFGTPGDYTQHVVVDCPGGSPWVWRGVVVTNTSTGFFSSSSDPTLGTTGQTALFSYPSGFATNPAGLSYCANTAFSDAAASWSGGQLAVRFHYAGTLPDVGHWNVEAPDPGTSSGTTAGTVSTSATVDGYPGYYFASFALASLTNMTARIIAPDSATKGSGCFQSVTVSGNAIGSTPNPGAGDTGADGATSSNANCGFSLNPFHYLKCLFEPSSSLQQWDQLRQTAQTKPPLSFIIGGVPYVTGAVSYAAQNMPTDGTCAHQGVDCAPAFDDPTVQGAPGTGGTAHSVDFLKAAGDLMQGTIWGGMLYAAMALAVWVTALILMWRRVSASFGGK